MSSIFRQGLSEEVKGEYLLGRGWNKRYICIILHIVLLFGLLETRLPLELKAYRTFLPIVKTRKIVKMAKRKKKAEGKPAYSYIIVTLQAPRLLYSYVRALYKGPLKLVVELEYHRTPFLDRVKLYLCTVVLSSSPLCNLNSLSFTLIHAYIVIIMIILF